MGLLLLALTLHTGVCLAQKKVTVNFSNEDAAADLADYVRMSITYSQDKIKELYGQYPVILRKDSAVRVALESRGFIYNPEVPEDIVSKK